MLPTFALPARLASLIQPDWLGYRHALLRSGYAFLLALVMLLPANFVAYALSATLFHGGAFGGMQFAAAHHMSGFWLGTAAAADPVAPLVWWAAAGWEILFWASCLSGLTVFILWTARALAGQLAIRAHRLPRPLDGARAA